METDEQFLARLKKSWLFSDDILKSSFAVYGRYLLAGLIIGAVVLGAVLAVGGVALLSAIFR
jgi:uncharacterized protein (DUF2062 family)